MIDNVKKCLDSIDLKINIKKSICFRIAKLFNMHTADITMDSKPIAVFDEFICLAMYVCAAKSFKINLHETKKKYLRSLNSVLGKVGWNCVLM